MDSIETSGASLPMALGEPAEPTGPTELPGAAEPASTRAEWPWETLRAEQEARAGTFTDVMRHEYRWDEEGFARLEEAMRAACEALQGQTTIERWVGEGFWCWTAVIPELTEHPHFTSPDPHYLRQCLARLRDLGSWFFNGASPYAPTHVWEPVLPVR
jgi:hypothetical protein